MRQQRNLNLDGIMEWNTVVCGIVEKAYHERAMFIDFKVQSVETFLELFKNWYFQEN